MGVLKDILPPFSVRLITGMLYGWRGNYNSWEEAENKCGGYNSDIIFNKVKNALLKVKNGEATFERDSVLYDKVQYSFPLLAALSQIALQESGELKVLDFGGSMGSGYFQNRAQFKTIKNFTWSIVEQEHFVAEGKKTFADDHLNFFYTIEECLSEKSINTILLGSVLQYIQSPYELLKTLAGHKIKYIVIDRTPVFENKPDRITIQKVPKKIYEATYPCWILNEQNILSALNSMGYELIYDSESSESLNLKHAKLKGYFFKLKE